MKKLVAVLLWAAASLASAQTPAFGTFERLYSADSLWNSYPVNPVLGSYQIPKTVDPATGNTIYPSISQGAFSTGVFRALPTNPPVTITGVTSAGVFDADTRMFTPSVTIPHWPANVVPAPGGDGHAEVVDEAANRVYSFWQLRKQADGSWKTQQIAWSPLNGTGWGDPAHYWQGARAAGVPTSAGLIRISEGADTAAEVFEHALAMSLDFSALTPAPNHFVYPATAGDATIANHPNSGQIPEGARLMLPPDFDTTGFTAPMKKIAKTLMKYGAYVVDRNTNTSFAIYVEVGNTFKVMPDGWSNQVAAESEKIRMALRVVLSESGHINGNGVLRTPESRVNLLSLRGPYSVGSPSSPDIGTYDTYRQAVVFTNQSADVRQNKTLAFGVPYSKPIAGRKYKFYVESTGGATARLTMYKNSVIDLSTASIGNYDSTTFEWKEGYWGTLSLYKPAGSAGEIKIRFIELP